MDKYDIMNVPESDMTPKALLVKLHLQQQKNNNLIA